MSAHSNGSSSSRSGELPPELLIKIFSRLPVKSTLKFRCVSKAWFSLLSDPSSQKYLPRSMSGFFYRRVTETSLSFATVYPGKDQQLEFSSIISSISRSIGRINLRLLDSCNGLLLFECLHESKRNSLIVCNPTGNTWASIDMDRARRYYRFYGVRLIFDPKTSPHFKIATIRDVKNSQVNCITLELLIFSSATNDYEVSTLDMELSIFSSNWLERFSIKTAYFDEQTVELAIIKGENWPPMCQFVPLPRLSFVRDTRTDILGESGGRVHYAVCHKLKLFVWILEEEGSWVLKYVTSTRNLIKGHKEARRRTTPGFIMPLAFHPDLDVIFLQVEWTIYSFHPSSRSFELLASERGANLGSIKYKFHPFKSCLIAADPLASLATVRKIG